MPFLLLHKVSADNRAKAGDVGRSAKHLLIYFSCCIGSVD
jgi:hypothetical protein